MKNYFKFIGATVVLFSSLMLFACNNAQPDDPSKDRTYVNFKYDVCYAEGSNRVDKINKGAKAENWEAKRLGYSLLGWYVDSNYSSAFDFSTELQKDTIVYAKWKEGTDSNTISVTFNYNYDDCPNPVVMKIKSGQKIGVDSVPMPSRFGYNATGWYTNPNDASTKWSFLNQEFTKDTMLYANYEKDESLKRDENGDVIFEDVTIDFAPNILSWGGGSYQVESIVNKFNAVYAGKISVNIVPFDTTEVVTFEDTAFINEVEEDYYNAGEVLKSINHTFDESNYYADAISENYIAGTLKTIPVSHLVPFMVYNKQLLKELNVDSFPTDHFGIYDLLCKANEQFESRPNWKGALATSQYEWATYEIGSHAMWSNSNFRYIDYDLENKQYINNFKVETNKEVLYNAYVGANRIFGFNSEVNSGYADNVIDNFIDDNALACYLGFSTQFNTIRNAFDYNDKAFIQKYGVIPTYNLCNYKKIEDSHMFAKGLSVGIRNAGFDLTEVAAAAVFGEFLSNNSASLMSSYAYPAAKSVQNGEEFNAGDFESYILQKAVEPSTIYTLPGHKMNYKMYNYFNQNCINSVFNPSVITRDNADSLTKLFGNAMQTLLEE